MREEGVHPMADPVVIRPATEVEPIARRLITENHSQLRDATILYLFTNKESKRQGKIVAAKTTKCSPLERYLSSGEVRSVDDGADFTIVFDEELWASHDQAWRVACVDHELTHCSLKVTDDGEETWAIRPHDVEEFVEVVERHGLWDAELEDLGRAVGQLGFSDVPAMRVAFAAGKGQ